MHKKLKLAGALLAAVLNFGLAQTAEAGNNQTLACSTNNECSIDVYVSVGANQMCGVTLQYGTVRVAQARRPKVVWVIQKADPGDRFDYQFDPDFGIVIVGNDPNSDFDGKGHDSPNGRRFKWHSKNLRGMGFDYTVQVQRRANASAPWSNCTLLDPRIVNDGP